MSFRFNTLLTDALSKATKCFPTHRYHRHASMIYERPEADEIHSHIKRVNAPVLTRLLRYRFGFGQVGETAMTALLEAYNTEKKAMDKFAQSIYIVKLIKATRRQNPWSA